ncbi:MAG: hypothetical protein ACI9XZ_004189, partial [Alphaproteobacteria bacterium]
RKRLPSRASPYPTRANAPRPSHFPEPRQATTPGAHATRRLAPPPRRASPALLGEQARERKRLPSRASPYPTRANAPRPSHFPEPRQATTPGAHATRRLAPLPRRASSALLGEQARERKQSKKLLLSLLAIFPHPDQSAARASVTWRRSINGERYA